MYGALNHEKIAYSLGKISTNDRQSIKEMIQEIQSYQGVPTDNLKNKAEHLYKLAVKIGMLNPIRIISNRGLEKEFVFSTDILQPFTKNDDIMDDVKVLLASIRFGEKYTEFSTIQQPELFLRALLDNDTVGPHDANLTDYILLEKKGIVSVVNQTKSKFGRFGRYTCEGPCLKLLKKDVAEKALEIIKSPDYTYNSDNDKVLEALNNTGNYSNAEEIRVRLADSPRAVKEAQELLSMALRDETI